jgi:hypothetical protein
MLSEVEFRVIVGAIQSGFLRVAESRVVASREGYRQIGEDIGVMPAGFEGGIRVWVYFWFPLMRWCECFVVIIKFVSLAGIW